ncbi:H-NS histone family protein [Pelomonas sp. UHG3]|uniref:H-NS histone family protein n=1 Tax=Roseateles hydrophilus TaxID=2975054 RepID=A0ACC6CB96_9BURK|nr:H-NS histone family protein [Pelomonas sp. UHG3]MCY4745676.1 H-NS histone family protein [Pelomonas sp. UHG3]
MPKSYKQVLAQIQKLQKEAESLRSKEVQGVIARIKEAISHYGLTAEDLFGGTRARKSKAPAVAPVEGRKQRKSAAKTVKVARPAKFRDEAGNTWSGIGKRPEWFKAALAAGKTADDLLIRD